MLIIKIHYGLGNQLFQYAFARALAIKVGIDFSLDISFFSEISVNPKHPRFYQLDQFNIKEQYADLSNCKKFTQPSFLERRWRNIRGFSMPYYKQKIVREKQLDFDENMWKVNNKSYLFGYWQDLRYFSEFEELIRSDFIFKYSPDVLNQQWEYSIRNSNSVCLHIRRGDYTTDTNIINFTGICDLSYYYKAVELIIKETENPVFFIFSDDPQWVKANFHLKYSHYFVDHNSESQAVEDLFLMSACKHHSLANSSFSWWGAWLANNIDNIIISPKIWRKQGSQMFLPPHWRKL
jgi:hypothetical protein